MKKSTWNTIYFLVLFLPLVIWLLSTIQFAVGGTIYNLSAVSSAVPFAISKVGFLMPVSNLVALMSSVDLADILEFGAFGYLSVGLDMVLWLSCLHIVLDLFMFFTTLIHNFFDRWGCK